MGVDILRAASLILITREAGAMSTQGIVRAKFGGRTKQRWKAPRGGPPRAAPPPWSAARHGPLGRAAIRGRPPNGGILLNLPIKIAFLGLVLTIVSFAARPAAATLIDSFSGVFTTSTAATDTLMFPANATAI